MGPVAARPAGHGNALFFSALIPLALLAIGYGVPKLRAPLAGLAIGVAAHLAFFAVVPMTTVQYVPVGVRSRVDVARAQRGRLRAARAPRAAPLARQTSDTSRIFDGDHANVTADTSRVSRGSPRVRHVIAHVYTTSALRRLTR